ncbi:restriction endonuclease [uncultured Thiothrix sp.]|jgi:restriction system protein|uniref:restriction endonuclease n=1 Tax=uncultured Thiothrix sp. TaxID=223185 RepID=UPI002607CBCF|nr:restriction endonuclease [uncultured Thiothrix sp.]HMT93621.1 restriction endonuclease [Thiolinea sp.]
MTRATYHVVVEHSGLGKWREIKGSDKGIVEYKARLQRKQWEEQWQQRLLKAQQQREKVRQADDEKSRKQVLLAEKEREKERLRQEWEDLKQSAEDQTQEARQKIEDVRHLLQYTLDVNDAIDWETIKSHAPFDKPRPSAPCLNTPKIVALPQEPNLKSKPRQDDFQPKRTLLARLMPSMRKKQDDAAESAYAGAVQQHQHECEAVLEEWQNQCAAVAARNVAILAEFEQRKQIAERDHEAKCLEWVQENQAYLTQQAEENARIDAKRDAYQRKESDAILDYCEMVLGGSQYPDGFPQSFDMEYQDDSGVLVVDYALPAREHMPSLAEVKFVQSKRSINEVFLSDRALDTLYDDALYQIVLRTLHELFEADTIDALSAVVLNGLVTAIDKTTGNHTITCILSIYAKKEDFLKINLAQVEPKACFKALKGVGSSKLHGMTAVAPILNINREDRRFVNSYDVADSLDASVNLATMGWEDFEHLIREVFAKEFSASGGEVKVTQASRDGGVDAVAFDPDPIRGGKIVIQAKRYTNTVGVSAVRDLHGTVMHEGATKGILVTTANYGPDAYEFAANKPLTLLNGANLLHLLEKHGHQARINLQEAKQK